MIIPSNLEISIIMTINKKNKFFDKTNLYNELINNNIIILPIDICHFLFTWERLLVNDNFVRTVIMNDIEYITTKKFNPPYHDIPDPIESVNLNLNLKNAINHMCKNKEIYANSSLIKPFLLKYFPMYKSIDELLDLNINLLGKDKINEFKDLYINAKKDLALTKSYLLNNTVIKTLLFNLIIGTLGVGSLYFLYRNVINKTIR
jgi:hypothetical protein